MPKSANNYIDDRDAFWNLCLLCSDGATDPAGLILQCCMAISGCKTYLEVFFVQKGI